MLLRRPHDLAGLFRDGRARMGWSQNQLAETVGVSRQWISLVENGKTSVEFDLVLAALQALGYYLHVDTSDLPARNVGVVIDFPSGSVHESSGRTPLTRHGDPLGRQRARRARRDRDE
ncbi:MAG: helix-turn-helix transcriptional regulator [Gemmatimonadota bacterium]